MAALSGHFDSVAISNMLIRSECFEAVEDRQLKF